MRGRLGLTWTLFSLCPARASAHLLTTRKRAAVLPAAVVQLHGLLAGTPIFFCQASLALPLSGVLMGVAPARFPFAGQYSVRETNAQPAPATGLFKGFGTLSQQAKTDFRRTRRKSVLSICGNKCTACKLGEGSAMRIDRCSALCYTLSGSIRPKYRKNQIDRGSRRTMR